MNYAQAQDDMNNNTNNYVNHDTVNDDTQLPADATPQHRDPYTISADGHFVGHDGFIVPKNFEEFYERYPKYIRNFLRRRWARATDAELEDREQDLLMFLMSLPEVSKFREPGFNGLSNGCSDRIQVFHPDSNYGCSGPRFFSYINLCLLNMFMKLSKKNQSNPIARYNTISLYSNPEGGENATTDEDYLYLLSTESAEKRVHYDDAIEDGIFVKQFVTYVEHHNPELVPVIDAIAEADTYVEAQTMLGMTEKLFIRARNRLTVLHASFDGGTAPPRQRKVYRDRVRPSLHIPAYQGSRLSYAVA